MCMHTYIYLYLYRYRYIGFSGGLVGKEYTCNVGDLGLIPGLGRSPGGWYGNAVQYSYLENPMDKGTWKAIVHVVTKCWTGLND